MADVTTIVCRKCKRSITVSDQLAMMFVQCPTCEDRILVPAAGTPPTPEDAPDPLLPAAQVISRRPAITVEMQEAEKTDTPGLIGLMFGMLALSGAIVGFLVGGTGALVVFPAAIIMGLSGGMLAYFGQGGLKIAGMALNSLAFVLVAVLAVVTLIVSSGQSPEQAKTSSSTSNAEPASRPPLPVPEVLPDKSTVETKSTKQPAKPKAVVEREEAKQSLLARLQAGQNWKVSLPGAGGVMQEYQLTVITADDKGAACTVLAENAGDPFERALLNGKLEYGGAAGPTLYKRPGFLQGWYVAMRPAAGAGRLGSLGATLIVLYVPPDEDSLAVGYGNERYAASLGEPVDLSPAAFAEKYKAALTAGTRWSGKGEIGSKPTAEVVLTCMEWRDEGGYVRLIAESKEDPTLAAVYEGSLGVQTPAGLLWPVTLQKSDSAFSGSGEPLLADGVRPLQLLLSADGEMLLGLVGGQRLRLKRNAEQVDVQDFAQRVRRATAAGSQWSGHVSAGPATSRELDLTFTDVRDDGQSVRAVATMPDEPSGVAVFTGQLQLDEANLNGCSVALKPARRESSRSFFGAATTGSTAQRLCLRLSPDGSRMYGRTSGGESVVLKPRISEVSAAAVSHEARAALVKEKLAKGSQWAGKLENSRLGQTINVNLKCDSADEEERSLQVSVSTTSKGRTTKITFEGRLVLGDERVDGYAAELKKTSSGKANGSPIFSPDMNARLLLRLSLDGDTLYGRASSGGSPADEVLVLKRKEPAKN